MTRNLNLLRHNDSFLTLKSTAIERRFDCPYRKTFEFDGDAIDDFHSSIPSLATASGMIDAGIEGWLLPQDAQKLYEMAYYSSGDIFELGTYRGLSASIMARALQAAGRDAEIITVDLDPLARDLGEANLSGRPGGNRVHIFIDEGATAVRNQAAAGKSYGFAFIDHAHVYEPVLDACRSLHRIVDLGGFALFHDFNDPRNAARDELDYGVYQGVMDGLDPRRWEFWGIYGCTGLFRRHGDL
jgi:predicted O-methyltransferase YrrM